MARFTAASGTALHVPTLDLSPAATSFAVTVVARMWIGGTAWGRIIGGAAPHPRDWFFGWSFGSMDALFYTETGWVGDRVPASATREWFIYTATRDGAAGGAARLYRCGAAVVVGSTGGGPNGLFLGGGYRSSQQQQLWELSDADVAEVIVHTGVPSTQDRQRLEGALARKYGVAHRLPGAHPSYATQTPLPVTTAMPTPRVWLRPELLPSSSGALSVWPNSGTGGGANNATYVGTGPVTPPTALRTRFANGTACTVPRFTASLCSRLYIPTLDLTADTSSYTVLLVSRMWGATRGRVLNDVDYAIIGWHGGRMDSFHASVWIYNGALAQPQFGAYSWQLHTMRRAAPTAGAPSETTVFSNGVELARAPGLGGFHNLGMGGLLRYPSDCGESSDADVAEVLVYDSALSPAELDAATSYLQARYAIGADEPPAASSSATASLTPSATASTGASATRSVTPTATVQSCVVDESFVGGAVPLSWAAQPPALISVTASAPPRGRNGATVYDPLSTGSPFVYLTTGAGAGVYTTLSVRIVA